MQYVDAFRALLDCLCLSPAAPLRRLTAAAATAVVLLLVV
jgi:hypothetical protein